MPTSCHPRPAAKGTISTHLRKAWDDLFIPGETSTSAHSNRLRQAARKLGIIVCIEERKDYPVPGLSGVLVTRLPRGMTLHRGRASAKDRTLGL